VKLESALAALLLLATLPGCQPADPSGVAEFRGSLALAAPDRLVSPVGELSPDGTIWTAYRIRPAPFDLESPYPLLVAHWSTSGALLDSATVGTFERSHSPDNDLSLTIQGDTIRLTIARAGEYFTRLESTDGREWRPFPAPRPMNAGGASSAWLADVADLRHSKVLGVPWPCRARAIASDAS